MTNSILAMGIPGIFEIIIVLILVGIPIALVVWFIKMITKNKNENIRLRLEVGKLADEIEKVRKGESNKSNNNNEEKQE